MEIIRGSDGRLSMAAHITFRLDRGAADTVLRFGKRSRCPGETPETD
jgi:hypothetical protein